MWWRQVMLPGIFSYYVTGAITASGGSWNAAIVAEVASWGDDKIHASGLGYYIAQASAGRRHGQDRARRGGDERFRPVVQPHDLAARCTATQPAA